MCVGLVAHFAQIRLVRRVDVHVFLSVTAVRESSVTSLKLALERFLSCRRKTTTRYTYESDYIYFFNEIASGVALM